MTSMRFDLLAAPVVFSSTNCFAYFSFISGGVCFLSVTPRREANMLGDLCGATEPRVYLLLRVNHPPYLTNLSRQILIT